MNEHAVSTESGQVTASSSVLAEATAELIQGLRRLSTPDDLRSVVDWDMAADWAAPEPQQPQ